MDLLLDTPVVLWWLGDDRRLQAAAREAIADAAHRVLVSAATVLELTVKERMGRVRMPAGIAAGLRRSGFDELSLGVEDADAARALPPLHPDPFDRLLVAQAQRHGLVLVTANQRLAAYGIATLAT